MRCPKCGYISFDHVETCLRCNKDVKKVASVVEGTTYNVAAPSFLKFPKAGSLDQEQGDEISFDGSQDDYDVVDPDLDVLVDGDDGDDGDDAGISFGDEFSGFADSEEQEEEDDFEINLNEDDDEGLDLGQFEDAFEEEEPQETAEIALDMPDELADISDLSAPEKEPAAAAAFERKETSPAAEDSMDEFNLDLDLEQLGEEFSLSSDDDGETAADSGDDDGLGDLSLDDIGLSSAGIWMEILTSTLILVEFP
jgi:hypothetical protein